MSLRRDSTASSSTYIDLQELDPSPIDSPSDWEIDLEKGHNIPPPSPPKFGRSSTLGLSGAGHGPVYYLTRIQRYSSYAFTVFGAMHIANTSLIPLFTRSVSGAESFLLLTRPYYRALFSFLFPFYLLIYPSPSLLK